MEQNILSFAQRRLRNIASAVSLQSELLENNRESFFRFLEGVQSCDVQLASSSNSFHFLAVGKSAGVAKVIVAMLQSVGIRAHFIHPVEAVHGDLGSIAPGDYACLISNSGGSQELLDVCPFLEKKGCALFAITGNERSPLAGVVGNSLLLSAKEEHCPLKKAPITSTVVTLALGQAIVAAVMELRHYDKESYAKNHPGGSIGRHIALTVEQVMSSGEQAPFILPEASFSECISAMTDFAQGALMVCDSHQQFLGLIAERDLRLAMNQNKEKVFSLKAQGLMNQNPTTVAPHVLAIDALKIMEEREKPFSVLPVVEEGGRGMGLLRVHQLFSVGLI